MSRQKSNDASKPASSGPSGTGWQEAIEYAAVLTTRTGDRLRKEKLAAAMDWFRYRLKTGEPWLSGDISAR